MPISLCDRNAVKCRFTRCNTESIHYNMQIILKMPSSKRIVAYFGDGCVSKDLGISLEPEPPPPSLSPSPAVVTTQAKSRWQGRPARAGRPKGLALLSRLLASRSLKKRREEQISCRRSLREGFAASYGRAYPLDNFVTRRRYDATKARS